MPHYVIVGAGSAGCVLASRLSEDPAAEVVLIEAGPPDKAQEIHIPVAWPHSSSRVTIGTTKARESPGLTTGASTCHAARCSAARVR